MAIDHGKRIVDYILTDNKRISANERMMLTDFALRVFPPEVQNRTQDPAAHFHECINTCGNSRGGMTLHDPRTQELAFWHIGLMIAEYVAGLIADKAKEGVCHADTKPDPVCDKARAMYKRMLARFKHDLGKLIEGIEQPEADEPNWPQAGTHPPQQPGQPPLPMPPPTTGQPPAQTP
jgi:hypothetical protein